MIVYFFDANANFFVYEVLSKLKRKDIKKKKRHFKWKTLR